jgi:hypothetical protein
MAGGFTEGKVAGLLHEWRNQGEPRRWKITVRELDLPLLLHPFSGAVRATIEQKAEAQSQAFENFRDYDVFMLEEHAGGRYALIGIRRDVVDDAIARFGKTADKQDVAIRREIARWLFTAPSMRSWITRGGPPYAVKVLTDETGLVHEIQVLHGRGQVGMKFSYLRVSGQPAWQEVLSTFTSNTGAAGYIEGRLNLAFADHSLNWSPQRPREGFGRDEPGDRADQPDGSQP